MAVSIEIINHLLRKADGFIDSGKSHQVIMPHLQRKIILFLDIIHHSLELLIESKKVQLLFCIVLGEINIDLLTGLEFLNISLYGLHIVFGFGLCSLCSLRIVLSFFYLFFYRNFFRCRRLHTYICNRLHIYSVDVSFIFGIPEQTLLLPVIESLLYLALC